MRTFGRTILLIAAFLGWGLVPVFAQTPPPDSTVPGWENAFSPTEGTGTAVAVPPGGTSSILTILRMVLVLALAALAVYGVVYFVKRAARPRTEQDPHLRVLARTNLGGTSAATVLAVGSQAWLVGSSDGGVSLIAEIEAGEALDAMLLDESMRREEAGRIKFPDFRSLFRQVRKDIPPASGPSAGNIRQHRDRLKGL